MTPEVLVMAVAFGIGFRPHFSVAGFAAALGVLLLFVAVASWLAARTRVCRSFSPEAANGAMFSLMFFTYASSALVPVRTMPWWLHGLARSQPATPVTIRGPLLRQPLGAHLFTALAWCGGILAVSVALSVVLFRRHTASAATPRDPHRGLKLGRQNPAPVTYVPGVIISSWRVL